MNLSEIKSKYRDVLKKLRDTYDLSKSRIQVRVESADALVLLNEYCPQKFTRMHQRLADGKASHALFSPSKLEELLSHEPIKKRTQNTAVVQRLGGTNMDSKADAGPA